MSAPSLAPSAMRKDPLNTASSLEKTRTLGRWPRLTTQAVLWLGTNLSPKKRSLLKARRQLRRLLQDLQPGKQDLLRFGQESEFQFTALAEGLSGLHEQISELRLQSEKLNRVLHDEDEDRALSSASELYKRSVDLVHASMGLALSEEEQMEEVEGRLLHDRGRFVKNSLQFRVLVMGIRTEAARLPPEDQSVFLHVASEIANMEERMTNSTELAFTQIEEVVKAAAEGRTELQRLQTGLRANAQRSIELIRGELDKIKTGLVPCGVLSQEISEHLAMARQLVEAMVTSLQYQDIVRQQLEHVATGFKEMTGEQTSSEEGRNGHRGDSVDIDFVYHATRVQQRHLNLSRQTIEKAGCEVMTGMKDILDTGDRLVEKFTEMESVASEVFCNCRLADLFRQETERLVEIASQSERTNQRISALVHKIEGAVQVFSREIAAQEMEVKLVALNAQIAAARLASAGAMNKLAEQTCQLSDDTAGLTSEMAKELRGTLSQLQKIKTETDESRQTITRERAELASEAKIVEAKLGRLNERVQLSSAQAGQDFRRVYEEVRALLPTLKFPSLVKECYEPSEDLCAEILEFAQKFVSEDEMSAEARTRLEAHQAHYTMAQERKAHQAIVAGHGPQSSRGNTDAGVTFFEDEPVAVTADDGLEMFDSPSTLQTSSSDSPSDTLSNVSPLTPAVDFATTAIEEKKKSVPPENFGEGVELF